MMPCTIALFSSGVPLMRLFEANLGRSERTTVIENRPLASTIIVPFGLGPYGRVWFAPSPEVSETSVHVPINRSLSLFADCPTVMLVIDANPQRGDCRTAIRDELAPVHSNTSSARPVVQRMFSPYFRHQGVER